MAAKEATLDRQIAEQTRLLLQLKSKRSLWGSECEAAEAPVPAERVEDLHQPATQIEARSPKEGANFEKNGQNGQTEPFTIVESMS